MRPFAISCTLLLALVVAWGVALEAHAQPASSPAAKRSAPVDEAAPPVVETVTGIVKMFKNHEVKAAIAACITLVVFLWRRFLGALVIKKIPTKHLAWVTALVGLVAALPAHLAVTPFVWWKFLLDGFLIGAEAALLWSTVGKHVLPKIFGAVKDG